MSSYFTLTLISDDHSQLWDDAYFFLSKSCETERLPDDWYAGAYARASVMLSAAAFESSCAHIFTKVNSAGEAVPDREFSRGGLLRSIRRELTNRGFQTIDITEPYWISLQSDALDIRNGYAHGKNEQKELFADSKGAVEIALRLLDVTKRIYSLAKRDTQWIDECCKEFAPLAV